MENSMTGSLPNKELDRAALAAGHFEIAEQDGLPFDLDRLNKELLEKGLEPFTAMSEVLQAVNEWQRFQAQATPRAGASRPGTSRRRPLPTFHKKPWMP